VFNETTFIAIKRDSNTPTGFYFSAELNKNPIFEIG